mmetsp:Transcript_1842/g.2487  ORF Transcript_1842/g.2487 Transcript_1842/m.2487 type:complete len:88 (-) Transcript_1842:1762-2025(-)
MVVMGSSKKKLSKENCREIMDILCSESPSPLKKKWEPTPQKVNHFCTDRIEAKIVEEDKKIFSAQNSNPRIIDSVTQNEIVLETPLI